MFIFTFRSRSTTNHLLSPIDFHHSVHLIWSSKGTSICFPYRFLYRKPPSLTMLCGHKSVVTFGTLKFHPLGWFGHSAKTERAGSTRDFMAAVSLKECSAHTEFIRSRTKETFIFTRTNAGIRWLVFLRADYPLTGRRGAT